MPRRTSTQRRNDRMFEIFDRAKSEGRGLNGNSHTDGAGVNSPAMKHARAGFEKKESPKSQALTEMVGKKITTPKHYRGNTNSEGGISFGKKPITLDKGKGRDGSMEHKATGLKNTRKLFD